MKKILKLLVKALATLLVIAIVFGISYCGVYCVKGYKEYKRVIEETPIEIKVQEVYSKEHFTKKEELPKIYIDAVIAVEDRKFYSHGAISVMSTLRAIFTNVKEKELLQGGSTITQQLAKNLYFDQSKDLTRKFAELFVAIDLEKKYTKDEIFELYVNNIYFGSGYYCIYDASMGYYGVTPAQLDANQATILAGVPNAPSVYSPDNNTPLTVQRQQQVIDCMVKYKFISEEEAQQITIDKGE